MVSIGAAAYQNNTSLLTKDSSLVQQNLPVQSTSSQDTNLNSTSSASGDQVTLSPAVQDARLRESLGLPPTGKVTRQNLTTQIQTDQAGVLKALQDTLTGLGLDPNTPIAVSQDAKGQIQVSGAGTNSAAIAKVLNANNDFTKMFSRLATNSNILNFPAQEKAAGATATLSDYLDGNNADSTLATLIQQYSAMKSSNNSLASLISITNNSAKPFTFSNSTNPSQAQETGTAPNLNDYLNRSTTDTSLASLLQQYDGQTSDQAQTLGSTPTLTDYLNNDPTNSDLTSILSPNSNKTP